MLRLVVMVLAGCAMAAGQTSAQTAYIHASRAALRAQPSPTAQILDYLTTNTELRIAGRSRDWCEVAVPGTKVVGFIHCPLLAGSPLTLADIERSLKKEKLTPDQRIDWAARAFWISPSLRRFVDYAAELEMHRGGGGTAEEYRADKPNRPPNAELNAMKALLASGRTVSSFDSRPPDWLSGYGAEPLQEALKRASLPVVTTSHFASGDPLFVVPLRPFSIDEQHVELADALSAVYSVPMRVRIVRRASMGNNGPMGAWDMGALGISFERPVRLEGITASGAATGADVISMEAALDAYCSQSVAVVNARPINSRWRSAVLGWIGKPPIAGRTSVKSQRVAGKGKFDKLVIDTFDVNGDGVGDFSMWSGVKPPMDDYQQNEAYWRGIFANIGGRWVLVRYSEEIECT